MMKYNNIQLKAEFQKYFSETLVILSVSESVETRCAAIQL